MIAISSLPFPVRHLLVGTLALAAAVGLLPQSCGDDRPGGFHTINVAWGDGELGLAWLDRQGNSEHVRFARSSIDPLRIKGDSIVASTRARVSEPPVLAWGAGRYLLGWTHAGAEPGVYIRAVQQGRPVGSETKIADGPARLCRQMVFTGENFAVAWATEEGIHLARIGTQGQLLGVDDHPVADAEKVTDCKLLWDGSTFRLLWSQHTGDLVMARVTASGELLASTVLGRDAGTVALATVGDDSLVVTTSGDQPGARLQRLDGALKPRSTSRWSSMGGHVIGVDITRYRNPFVIWAASKKPGARTGRIEYAFVNPGGTLSGPETLTRFGGRPTVNAVTSADGRVAVAWSDTRSNGTVRWALLQARNGDQPGGWVGASLTAATERAAH